jgi:hypothetical protein
MRSGFTPDTLPRGFISNGVNNGKANFRR